MGDLIVILSELMVRLDIDIIAKHQTLLMQLDGVIRAYLDQPQK
jgi:hypothetical protein